MFYASTIGMSANDMDIIASPSGGYCMSPKEERGRESNEARSTYGKSREGRTESRDTLL